MPIPSNLQTKLLMPRSPTVEDNMARGSAGPKEDCLIAKTRYEYLRCRRLLPLQFRHLPNSGNFPTMPLAPTVGVVLANHNNAAFVGKAIESVARQTVRDIRVIIVDDASTDESDKVIRDCLCSIDDDRFRYVKLQSNVGQAGAISRGLAGLDAPFVCFLDSDDVWYEGFIARHLEVHLNADFPVALTYCDSRIIDAQDRLLAGTAWWFDAEPQPTASRTMDSSLMPTLNPATGKIVYPANRTLTLYTRWAPTGATNSTASMMLRRSFVDLVLISPEKLPLYVDFYLSTFACLLTGAIAIHEALYAYRMHGRNKHSNAAVLGGAYNSSTRSWAPIRENVLRLIHSVLLNKADDIRKAFGDSRYAEAEAMVAHELAPIKRIKPPETLLAKAADLVRIKLNGNGERNGIQNGDGVVHPRDPS